MNRFVLVAVWICGCVVEGGSEGGGSLADCAGDYSGTYGGADEGIATATLHEDGVLEVTFTSDAGAVEGAEGYVTEDGDVSGEEGLNAITGSFDFGDCTASGTWYYADSPSGTWQISRD